MAAEQCPTPNTWTKCPWVEQLEQRVDVLETEQRQQGKDLAAVRAQVAIWAALGAILGGGLMTLLARLIRP